MNVICLKSVEELKAMGFEVNVMAGVKDPTKTILIVETGLELDGKTPTQIGGPKAVRFILEKGAPIYVLDREKQQYIDKNIVDKFAQLFEPVDKTS